MLLHATLSYDMHATDFASRKSINSNRVEPVARWRSWFVADLLHLRLRARPKPKSMDFRQMQKIDSVSISIGVLHTKFLFMDNGTEKTLVNKSFVVTESVLRDSHSDTSAFGAVIAGNSSETSVLEPVEDFFFLFLLEPLQL
ncbi:hypothetical protein TNCV_642911 [Trichonephila clavipes]|nr:hypothetical protein TNCV_642911 [Trichonephila clavipes]